MLRIAIVIGSTRYPREADTVANGLMKLRGD